MVVDYNTYPIQNLSCPNYGCKVKGSKLDDGDFSEYTFIGNLECPKCGYLIAFWQAPLSK